MNKKSNQDDDELGPEPFENEISPYQLAEKYAMQGLREGWTLRDLILELTMNWESLIKENKSYE